MSSTDAAIGYNNMRSLSARRMKVKDDRIAQLEAALAAMTERRKYFEEHWAKMLQERDAVLAQNAFMRKELCELDLLEFQKGPTTVTAKRDDLRREWASAHKQAAESDESYEASAALFADRKPKQ